MTDTAGQGFTDDDIKDLLAAIHADMNADPLTDDDLAAEVDLTNDPLDQDLSKLGPADVSTPVAMLTGSYAEESEAIAPELRERFVAAAGRGIDALRLEDGPLQQMLFSRRRSDDVDVAKVAEATGETEATIHSVEVGEVDLTEFSVAALARWTQFLDIEDAVAVRCLTHSFAGRRAYAGYGRSADVKLTTKQKEFIERFTAELGA